VYNEAFRENCWLKFKNSFMLFVMGVFYKQGDNIFYSHLDNQGISKIALPSNGILDWLSLSLRQNIQN
jgi:hypothetical protein